MPEGGEGYRPNKPLTETERRAQKGETFKIGNTVYGPPGAKVPPGATGVTREGNLTAYYPPKTPSTPTKGK